MDKDIIIKERLIGYLKADLEEYPERKERINEMIAWVDRQVK